MADGVSITAGSGTKIATDDCGTPGHAQLFKLAVDADGDATLVPASATDGLKVNIAMRKAEDAASADGDYGMPVLGVRNDANAGKSGTDGDYTMISVDAAGNVNVFARRDVGRVSAASSGLTTSTTAYTAGDQVGAQFTLASAARASGGSGTIVGVTLVDANDIIGAYDVVFFDSSATPASDNAAFSISDADALKAVGIVQLSGSFDIGGNRIAQAQNLAIPYVCNGGTSLYAMLICRVGHTFFAAGTDLQLTVYVEKN